jgi:hypothetical protein
MNDHDAYTIVCEKIAEKLASTVGSDNYSWGTSIDDPSIVRFTARVSMNDCVVFSCRKDSVFVKNLMRRVKKVAPDASATTENSG